MYKKITCLFLILTLAFSSSYAEAELQTIDIQRKAIVKLIESNRLLEERVSVLEKRLMHTDVQQPQGNRVLSKKGIFFTPANASSIRTEPSPRGTLVSTLRNPNKVEIVDITCKGESLGYWGKTVKGWIFISNPSYGFLVNENGERISQNYTQWCNH